MKYLLRSVSLLFAFLLIASLIGCSGASSSNKADTNQKAKTTEVKKSKETTAAKDNNNQEKTAAAASQQKETSASSAAKQGSSQTPSTVKSDSPASTPQSNQPASTTSTASSGQASASPQAPASAPAKTTTAQAPVQTVKITIIGPKDRGTLLGWKTVNITSGETILDVLLDAAGSKNVDYSGSGATAYVAGMYGIYERDYGAMSGWICKQNGTGIPRSAGSIKVNSGDQIEWIYQEN